MASWLRELTENPRADGPFTPLSLLVIVLMVLALAAVGLARFWASPTAKVVEGPPSGTSSTEVAGRPAPPTPVSDVVVYVSGAVAAPGVLTLPFGSRVGDSIDAAGGATPEAALEQLNLARIVVDGEQIHVGVAGEVPLQRTADSVAGTGCIDLNTASESDLQTLDGIGPKLAERIVKHRDANGPFSSNDALLEVSGIGQKLLGRMLDELC